jgi:hypothetical protein
VGGGNGGQVMNLRVFLARGRKGTVGMNGSRWFLGLLWESI